MTSINNKAGETDTENTSPDQYELILKWRTNLECLIKKSEFDSSIQPDESDKKLISVLDAMAYLDDKNKLLDENRDIQLSKEGFSTYQAKHSTAFDYLTQLTQSTSSLQSKPKFYFFSRQGQLEQHLKLGSWIHAIFHFLIMFLVLLLLGFMGLVAFFKTQDNLFVKLLLGWFTFSTVRTAAQLVSNTRRNATTPFRFCISLLGIHSLNTLLKVSVFCILPLIFISKVQPYWVDDIIIIGLFISCLINFRLGKESLELLEKKDLTDSEAMNV